MEVLTMERYLGHHGTWVDDENIIKVSLMILLVFLIFIYSTVHKAKVIIRANIDFVLKG